MAEFTVTGNVQVEVVIQQAKGKLQKQVEEEADEAVATWKRAYSRIGSFINTLTKAIISMFGVLIVWNTVLLPIEFVLGRIRDAVFAIVRGINEIEERTVALQAIIATTARLAEGAAENFKAAGPIAEAVIDQLMLRTRELIGTYENATVVLQTLLATGAARYVRNWQELVDLAILLTNAIVAVTPAQERQRQLASETAAFFTGSVRSTDRLAKLLNLTGEQLNRMRQGWEKNKAALDDLRKMLAGFEEAIPSFEQLVVAQATGIRDVVVRAAYQGLSGAYEVFVSYLERVFNYILANEDIVVEVFARIGSEVKLMLHDIWGTLKQINLLFDQGIIRALGDIVVAIGRIIRLVNFWIRYMILIYDMSSETLTLIWRISTLLPGRSPVGVGLELGRTVLETQEAIKRSYQQYVEFASDLSMFLADIASDEKIAVPVKRNVDTLGLLSQMIQSIGEDATEAEERLKAYNNTMKQLNSILEKTRDAIETSHISSLSGYMREVEQAALDFNRTIREALQAVAESGLPYSQFADAIREIEIAASEFLELKLDAAMQNVMKTATAAIAALNLELRRARGFDTTLEDILERYKDLFEDLRKIGRPDIIGEILRLGAEVGREKLQKQLEDMFSRQKVDPIPLPIKPVMAEEDIADLAEKIIQRVRFIRRGIIPGSEYEELTALLGRLKEEAELAEMILVTTGDLSREQLKVLNAYDAVLSLLIDLQKNISDVMMENFINKWYELVNAIMAGSEGIESALRIIATTAKSALQVLVSQFGRGLADFFVDLFSGEEALKSFKRFIGNILINFGRMAVELGVMSLIMSWIPLFKIMTNPAASAALIAIGTAMIALGTAMGGRGGSGARAAGAGAGTQTEPTFYFNQAQIDVNQALFGAAAAVVATNRALNETLLGLSVEDEGVLVKRGVNKVGGVTAMLGKEMAGSIRTTKSLGMRFSGMGG